MKLKIEFYVKNDLKLTETKSLDDEYFDVSWLTHRFVLIFYYTDRMTCLITLIKEFNLCKYKKLID